MLLQKEAHGVGLLRRPYSFFCDQVLQRGVVEG